MPATARRKSDATINLRVPARTRDLIDSAATLTGKSRTEFVLDSAAREAMHVLLDQRLFTLDPDVFDAFMARLDAPSEPPEGLKALMREKDPWEK